MERTPTRSVDPTLIARLSAGDAAAFRQVFDLYHPKLYAFSLKFTKSRVLSEEIVQDFSLVELGSPTARVDADAKAAAAGGDRQVRLYPNPADDQFTLHYFSPAGQGVKVTLANAVGRPLKAVNQVLHAGDNRIVVSTRDLPTGLYLVNVTADDGSVTPLKVVISR